MTNAGVKRKLFTSRGCQAVRLPKGCEFEGTEVRFWILGKAVFLAPVAVMQGDGILDWARATAEALGPLGPELLAQVEEEIGRLGEEVQRGLMPKCGGG
jgi:virulence-associated protein VagC